MMNRKAVYTILAVIGGVAGYVAGSWSFDTYGDRASDEWTAFDRWVRQYDLTIDLVTIWGSTVALVICGFANLYAWWAIRSTIDQTAVGRTLKPKKAAEAAKDLSIATLYALSLALFYELWAPEFWPRIILRVALFASALWAALAAIRFSHALWQTRNAPPERGKP